MNFNSLYVICLISFTRFTTGEVLQINRLTFERYEYKVSPSSGISINKCIAKSKRLDHITVDIEGTLNRTIQSIFTHTTVYRQFSSNEFRAFTVDMWEDFCGYMNGDKKNLVLTLVYPVFIQYTNFNHTCPYLRGSYFFKINDFYVNAAAPLFLVPSGRYRLEINIHEGFQGPLLATSKVTGSVSDHRVDLF